MRMIKNCFSEPEKAFNTRKHAKTINVSCSTTGKWKILKFIDFSWKEMYDNFIEWENGGEWEPGWKKINLL